MLTPFEIMRAAYLDAMRAKHAADIAAALYDVARAVALRDVGAPSGWTFDLFGDGQLKPQHECAKQCPLHQEQRDDA